MVKISRSDSCHSLYSKWGLKIGEHSWHDSKKNMERAKKEQLELLLDELVQREIMTVRTMFDPASLKYGTTMSLDIDLLIKEYGIK